MKLEKWLNFAGVLNIIVAVLMFLASSLTIIPVIFLVITGFFYREYFNKEDPFKRKRLLLVLGIINLLFNLISGIIALEVFGLIKNDIKYDIKENKSKRINVLLQLGIVLVLLSGIMIATNQTLLIPNLYKIIGLIILSMLFFFLSYVGKKYLKLESSFKTYFLLGISFIVISFIGLYYYELLGSISINRINDVYFYPLLFLLISLCSVISEKVLKIDKISYVTSSSIFITLFTWFNAIGLSITGNLLLLTFIISLINFIYSPSCKVTLVAKNTAYIISYILIPLNVIVMTCNNFDIISCLLALVTTLNAFHLFVLRKDNLGAIVSLSTLIINSLIIVSMSGESGEISVVFFQVMMIVFYFLIKLIRLENINIIFKNIYKYLFNVIFVITSIVSLFISSEAALFVTTLMLFQNIIGLCESKKEEIYLEPVKSLLFVISLILYINSKVELDLIFNLFIIEVIELILYFIAKNNSLKKIHYIMYLVFIGLITLISLDTNEIYLALIALISSIVPFLISLLKKEDNIAITILTSIALIIVNSSAIFNEIYYLNYLITFIIMVIYAYIFRKDNYKKYISLYSVAILLLTLIETLSLDYGLYISLSIIIYSYIGILIASSIEKKNSIDLFICIYFSIMLLLNMFILDIWVFISVSLISLVMVIFGFIKDFKKIKFTAIILFIVNLIYQLKDFWKDIPVAIYLLVIGLILIGFVVVKEIRDKD